MNGQKQTMHMKDGQRMNQHIARFPAPVVFQGLGIAEHVAVRKHGPFAATCGATGVQNSGQIIGLALHHLVFVRAVRRTL